MVTSKKTYSKKKYKWLPFKFVAVYTLILLVLAFIGPVRYEFDFFPAVLVVFYIVGFLVVTKIGMNEAYSYKPRYVANRNKKRRLIFIIKVSLLITLPVKLLLVLSSIQIFGIPSFDDFFSTLASVYTELHSGESGSNVFRQIDTFCTVVFYFSTFAGIYWKKNIGKPFVVILIVNVILDLFYNISFIGTQRSIITMAILALSVFLVNSIKSNYSINKRKLRILFILLVLLFFFFLNVLSARKSLWNSSSNYIYNNQRFDLSSPLLLWCSSDKMKYDVCTVISYFTQGFYGLSLSFQIPFEWTFMLGSVRGLNSILSQIFSFLPNMVDATYPLRAGDLFNHDGLANWYTIFPWLASDLTFVGALIYMGFVAWLFMRCWIQSVEHDNPIAFSFLVLLLIQYVFLIANNQLFVSRGESLATILMLIIYLIWGGVQTSRRENPDKNRFAAFTYFSEVAA